MMSDLRDGLYRVTTGYLCAGSVDYGGNTETCEER